MYQTRESMTWFIYILVKHMNMPVQDMLEKEKVNKLVEYSTFFPKAVNAADLLENQESGEYTESCSYKFLREELAVRMAHLVMELQHLPKELRLEEKMLFLMQSYSSSFSELIEFEKRDPDQQTLLEFKEQLVTMKKRHKVCSIYQTDWIQMLNVSLPGYSGSHGWGV